MGPQMRVTSLLHGPAALSVHSFSTVLSHVEPRAHRGLGGEEPTQKPDAAASSIAEAQLGSSPTWAMASHELWLDMGRLLQQAARLEQAGPAPGGVMTTVVPVELRIVVVVPEPTLVPVPEPVPGVGLTSEPWHSLETVLPIAAQTAVPALNPPAFELQVK
jgi:hypothetical protein